MVGICFLLWWWWSQFFHHWTLLILLMVVGWRFIVAFLWCYSRHRTGNNGIYNAYDVSPDDVRWPTEAGVLSGIQTWLENPTVCSMIFPANLPCYRGFSSHVWWLEATSIWRPTGVTSSFFFVLDVLVLQSKTGHTLRATSFSPGFFIFHSLALIHPPTPLMIIRQHVQCVHVPYRKESTRQGR